MQGATEHLPCSDIIAIPRTSVIARPPRGPLKRLCRSGASIRTEVSGWRSLVFAFFAVVKRCNYYVVHVGPRCTHHTGNGIHSHPTGDLRKGRKKSGWHGSLTLSLDKGDQKKHQTNRVQTHCSPAALQSDSAASGSETCARDRRGFHGAILQRVESRGQHALCATDPRHRSERRL